MNQAACRIIILIPGYILPSSQGKMRASCTITLIKGRINVIVDTGIPAQKDEIVAKLAENGLTPSDIDFVILTHGHSDHIGNNNLFPNATFLLDTDVSRGDEYWIHDFQKGPFLIEEGLYVIQTPGHSDHDLSVIVETAEGTVAVAGDVFEYEKDWIDRAWEPWSKNPATHRKSRQNLAQLARHIVPGHGPMFRAPSQNDLA